jgi:DNA modification methylase
MHTVTEQDWLDLAPSLDAASIDLLYTDPPFNTGKVQSSHAGSYDDAWPTTDAWIDWLRVRLVATLPALKPTANILLHLDHRTSHRARVLLDDLLGADRFVNHLIWSYGLGGSSPRRFARKHDDILFYCLDPQNHFFDPPMVPATSNRMKGQLKKATDVIDIPAINNMAAERTGYPTQKPLALLDLLIRACCPGGTGGSGEKAGDGAGAGAGAGGEDGRGDCPGGVQGGKAGTVLDPCCGSGTTLVAARAAGRNVIGCDLNPEAVNIARQRLAAIEPVRS